MTDEEWAAWEVAECERHDRFRDRARVLGFTLFACGVAVQARVDLEKAVDALERARKRAEAARAKLNAALEHAETMSRCAMAGDPRWNGEVAACLEELLG